MAPHSSSLAWKIPWTEEPGRLQSMGSPRVRHDWATSLSLSCIGAGNGSPLQCSCLENPREGGAWRAAVYGVERLLLNHTKTPGFLASRGEFNPGPEIRLDHSELLCNKVLLKYKGDREIFWHRNQKGVKRVPLASVSHGVTYSLISYYSELKECLEVVKSSLDLLHNLHLKITGLARSVFSRDCPQAGYIIVI